jgi:hypothetical protein
MNPGQSRPMTNARTPLEGGQSCPQPPFRRLARLEAGDGQVSAAR